MSGLISSSTRRSVQFDHPCGTDRFQSNSASLSGKSTPECHPPKQRLFSMAPRESEAELPPHHSGLNAVKAVSMQAAPDDFKLSNL
jgi:hypothetical protein